jgi:hypothetical protein
MLSVIYSSNAYIALKASYDFTLDYYRGPGGVESRKDASQRRIPTVRR